MTPSGMTRPATRADVARLAGVSTAVVSYVVNEGPRPVADATRERVLRAIRTLDYRPNASARALKRGSTRMLGLVLSEIINPFHSECIDALDAAASQRGFSMLLASTHGDQAREHLMRANLVERGVDGLIFLSVFPDRPSGAASRDVDAGLPRLIFDRSQAVQGFSTVGADAVEGGRLATGHLLAHGHRRIAYLGGPLDPLVGPGRAAGWEQSLAEAGADVPPPVLTEWSRAGGAAGVRILMDSPEPPTAIFAGSDLMAVGALQALHEVGKRVPEDVAVVSFDGTAESEYSWPALTAVRAPYRTMADAAIAAFIDVPDVPRAEVFGMELVARVSCGCRGRF